MLVHELDVLGGYLGTYLMLGSTGHLLGGMWMLRRGRNMPSSSDDGIE